MLNGRGLRLGYYIEIIAANYILKNHAASQDLVHFCANRPDMERNVSALRRGQLARVGLFVGKIYPSREWMTSLAKGVHHRTEQFKQRGLLERIWDGVRHLAFRPGA